MSFEALLPASSIVASICKKDPGEISLRHLRDYAIARYRDELACTRGELDADQARKDRVKVNQYSSSAFNLAERQAGWEAPAELALQAALVLAEKKANNRKPRAELQRALKHLRQLKNKPSAGVRTGSFKGVLSHAIENQDHSIAEIARRCKIGATKLWKWAYDKNEPEQEAQVLVNCLEACLLLKPGHLWRLLTPRKPRIHWPKDFPTCPKLRDRIRRKYKKLPYLSEQEQASLIWGARKLPPTPRLKKGLDRKLDNWPKQLAAELQMMQRIKKNRSEPALMY